MSRVKPILFNTEMVRATLDKRRTVTRRVIKPQPTYSAKDGFSWKGAAYGTDLPPTAKGAAHNFVCACPYKSGDILYVRETFSPMYKNENSNEIVGYMYKADEGMTVEEYNSLYPNGENYQWEGYWRPSIHMPKEAARIWLKVTNVKVERLQDITAKEALKSGMGEWIHPSGELNEKAVITEFIGTWNSTIKKKDLPLYGWNANPWVWVTEFERCEKPEGV